MNSSNLTPFLVMVGFSVSPILIPFLVVAACEIFSKKKESKDA